jgi:hypothetical protein
LVVIVSCLVKQAPGISNECCDVTRQFHWVPRCLTLWPWPLCLTDLLKTLTLDIPFEWYVLGFWYFAWAFVLWQDLSMGLNIFDFVTLTCMFDLLTENFNLGSFIFWMACIRILIFHMSICCDKNFPQVPSGLTLWPWPWCLMYILKTLTIHISFDWYVLELWYFTWVFVVTRWFQWVRTGLILWTWPLCLTYLLNTLTLAVSFKWYVLGFWYFTWMSVVIRLYRGYQQVWLCELDLCVIPT